MKSTFKALAVLAAIAAVAALTGCSTVPGNLTNMSKPLLPGRYTVVKEQVQASENQYILFGYGLGDLRGSMARRLYKEALAQAPGADALIEYTIDTKRVNLAVFQVITTTLTGTAVQSRGATSTP